MLGKLAIPEAAGLLLRSALFSNPYRPRRLWAALLSCSIGFANFAVAQAPSPLAGEYSGNYMGTNRKGPMPVGVRLVIEKTDGDAMTATATQSGGGCAGTYTLEGRREKDHLIFHAKSAAAPAGCTFDLDLVPQGDGFSGTKGKDEIKLSR